MDFSPNNRVVKLCLKGIGMEEKGATEEAGLIFLQAWNQAAHDFEKFISAHFIARTQKDDSAKLSWLETALRIALKIDNATVKSAFPFLYSSIAKCYEGINNHVEAKKNYDLAASIDEKPSDEGPFFHGTKADLQVGDLLKTGEVSNYKLHVKMNHIYFTALVNGAGLAAELAKGDKRARVYVVEPTGPFENDPNVTNSKFPGNPTRSYRSLAPLKVIGEVIDWKKLTPEELEKWHERLAGNKGDIIN